MSHLKSITTRIRDPVALAAACRRLGWQEPTFDTIALSSLSVHGWIVQLPKWHGPIVIDVANGQLVYENAKGHCQEPFGLSKLLQAYACEKARIEGLGRGCHVSARMLSDGSILISIDRGGV